jgi:hypothetical protein
VPVESVTGVESFTPLISNSNTYPELNDFILEEKTFPLDSLNQTSTAVPVVSDAGIANATNVCTPAIIIDGFKHTLFLVFSYKLDDNCNSLFEN